MHLLSSCANNIDRLSTASGRLLGWFTLAMVLLQSAVVLLRYGLGDDGMALGSAGEFLRGGSVALQDSAVYLHGAALMLGLAYALQTDAHVRVDVLYRQMSPRRKAWVNATGTILFLLPLCAFTLVGSWQFAAASWAVRESSANAGGLAGVYLLKSVIPLAATTLALQGIAQLARALEQLMRVETPSQPQAQTRTPQSPQLEEMGA